MVGVADPRVVLVALILVVPACDSFVLQGPTSHSDAWRGDRKLRSCSLHVAQIAPALQLRSPFVLRSTFSSEFAELELDNDFKAAMNEACGGVMKVCHDLDTDGAKLLADELRSTQEYMKQEAEEDTSRFLGVLLDILQHNEPEEAPRLRGPYRDAYIRLVNSIDCSGWRVGSQLNAHKGFGTAVEGSNSSPHNTDSSATTSDDHKKTGVDSSFYDRLGLEASATKTDIKVAFRTLAMETHPDVSEEEDAAEKFRLLSEAYNVLSDSKTRRMYDMFGPAGLDKGHDSGGNAADEWDELAQWVRKNSKQKEGRRDTARKASAQRSAEHEEEEWEGWEGVPQEWRSGVPRVGDVVTYPLTEQVREDLADGREFGLALLVGRNIDRGDARKIPAELLAVCEVEPLALEDDGWWRADVTASSAFPKLTDLETVVFEEYAQGGVGENGMWRLCDKWDAMSPQGYAEDLIL